MRSISTINREEKCQRMMISTKEKVIQTANRIRPLLTDELKLTARPILTYLVNDYNVNIMTYKEVERDYHIGQYKLRGLTQSDDAVSYYLPSTHQFHLLYNSEVLKERKVWSICHEAGHIIREHQICCPNGSDKERALMEWEANTFAREILAPTALVYGAIAKFRKEPATRQDLYFMYRHLFGLSKHASSLASNIVYNERPEINPDILQYYRDKLTSIFPFIKTRREYEELLACITRTEYDTFKYARDYLDTFNPIRRSCILAKI